MRVLITGGAGFVGSHVVDASVERDDTVLVVDDLSRGRITNLTSALCRGVELVQEDVRVADAMKDTVKRFDPEVVFHLAAQVDVQSSLVDPVGDAHRNVVGTVSVLSAAAAAGVRRVVLSSTGGAIYGNSSILPTPETVPPDPSSAYGLGKWTSECYGSWFRRAMDVDVVTLRYSNVYGPRQSIEGESGVVAQFCAAALSGRPPVVFGDGLQSRDFVFIDDVVGANLAAASTDHHSYHEYNVGTGIEITVLDLLETIRAAAGLKQDSWLTCFADARGGEVRRSCLDISRARRELMLTTPMVLRTGIERTLAWMRSVYGEPSEEPA